MTSKPTTRPRDLELAREYARRLAERLGDNLVSVTLYGSRARGDAREGSDFDLIVQVRERSKEVHEVVTDVDCGMMNEFEELFVGLVYDEQEWAFTAGLPFGWNVEREGVSF